VELKKNLFRKKPFIKKITSLVKIRKRLEEIKQESRRGLVEFEERRQLIGDLLK
jgi:hypothetical protein